MSMESSKSEHTLSQELSLLSLNSPQTFVKPAKKINDGADVSFFLTSRAHADIMRFLMQLNKSMFPRKDPGTSRVSNQGIDDENVESSTITMLRRLLDHLQSYIEEAPPDTGPRRFGNVSFRRWYQLVEERVSDLLEQHIPLDVLRFGHKDEQEVKAKDELQAYLLGSFGSAQRLDYGTGHELSFLAFLGCIWKLGGFPRADPGIIERNIVLGVIEPYLKLVRRLILTYTLEPAGSHGVWGLDDHSFLPYIFGSAQLSPAIDETTATLPVEGSAPDAPDPSDVAKAPVVEAERKRNMYFSAIGFIYDVKKGPFWEHSPMLFDISGVRAGWAKINKGMIKMYNAEVLSKFPVVQHFPFGSLFQWERDPSAVPVKSSVHTSNLPAHKAGLSASEPARPGEIPAGTKATGASTRNMMPIPSTRFPAREPPLRTFQEPSMKAPWADDHPANKLPPTSGTRAPWARDTASSQQGNPNSSAKTPWAPK
ncbi:MAG: Serine/threonine-protein phosphatase 2A activator 1 [Bogoriella megaspora]|nr:MAG: Serine/threonine-protein phosphatase 2A activator 1 [Bogoriella megaspora]